MSCFKALDGIQDIPQIIGTIVPQVQGSTGIEDTVEDSEASLNRMHLHAEVLDYLDDETAGLLPNLREEWFGIEEKVTHQTDAHNVTKYSATLSLLKEISLRLKLEEKNIKLMRLIRNFKTKHC